MKWQGKMKNAPDNDSHNKTCAYTALTCLLTRVVVLKKKKKVADILKGAIYVHILYL